MDKKIDKKLEKTVQDILKSKARSLIYLYLLKEKGAKTEQIIKGTNLHPSTVRETLSKMHNQKLIYRKKIKNNTIGKNPYQYYAIPPIKLLRRYASEIEKKLNKLATLSNNKKEENYKPVKIEIKEGTEKS